MRPSGPSHQTPYWQVEAQRRQPSALLAGHEPRLHVPSGQMPQSVGFSKLRPGGKLPPSGPGVMARRGGGVRVNASLTWSLGMDESATAVVMERSPRRAARWAPGAPGAPQAAGHG